MTPDDPGQPPAGPAEASSRPRALLAAAIIAGAALLAYANSFHGPFVFDDLTSITDNPSIRTLAQAWRPPQGQAQGGLSVAGRPLLNLSLGLNYAISRYDVWSYHALNLLIHVLAGLTLFGLVRRTLARPPLSARFGRQSWSLALIIAVLWTVHPLQTEAVTYVIQRAESLMGLFFLLTLYCFVRALDSSRPGRWMAGSVAACLLGVAIKEIAALAPFLALLYDRTFASGSLREAWRRHRGSYLALFATWVPLLLLLAGTGGNRGGTFQFSEPSVWIGHALTQFEAVDRYFWLAFCPYPLVFDYGEIPPPGLGWALLWATPVLLLIGATVVALRRWPAIGFLGAWVFVILTPTSALPATLQIIVEHRMYLPLAAIVTLAVTGAYQLAGRQVLPVFLVVGIVAGWMTFERNADYRTEIALWGDTVAKRPSSARAHNNLGHHLFVAGRARDAIVQYEKALALDPKYIDAHNNLGSALLDLPGRAGDAIAQYQEALRLKPDYPEVRYNLGNAWLKVPGHLDDAIAELQEALRMKPDYVEAHWSLGNALAKAPGRQREAIGEYLAALRLDPGYAEAHFSLGNIWLATPGRLDDAVAEYQAALRLKPTLAEAHSNLASAWVAQPGRLNDAIAEYQEALRLKPDLATAHFSLAGALATIPGRLNDAIAEYQEALRLKPDYAEAHYNLGNALVNVPGRMNDVIVHYQEAVRLRPDYAEAHMNLGNALYMQGRFPESVTQFNETLRLMPDNPDGHFNLAVVLLNLQGRLGEARAHLEAALRLQPGNDAARDLLAKVRAAQR